MKTTITARRNEIARRVLQDGHISVRELADDFAVSTETIRKDLLYLEERNLIVKGHGDATLASVYQESPFYRKEGLQAAEKARIAARAVAMVPDNGVVILDSGTTVASAAPLLSLRRGMTIITDSLAAAQSLSATENHVLVVGGEIREASRSLVGTWAAGSIRSVEADIALMACDGFQRQGPGTRSYRELEVKRAMTEAAAKVILLCDSSKLSLKSLYCFGDFQDFDCLVTDDGITDEQRRCFGDLFELIVV